MGDLGKAEHTRNDIKILGDKSQCCIIHVTYQKAEEIK